MAKKKKDLEINFQEAIEKTNNFFDRKRVVVNEKNPLKRYFIKEFFSREMLRTSVMSPLVLITYLFLLKFLEVSTRNIMTIVFFGIVCLFFLLSCTYYNYCDEQDKKYNILAIVLSFITLLASVYVYVVDFSLQL